MRDIYIDADACPVKEETYRVAERYGFAVRVVANRWMRIPGGAQVRLDVVPGGFDVVDDFIAARAGNGDLVITGDILLAARCLKQGARVLGTRGRPFTEEGIGEVLASRALMDHLRQMGEPVGGPAPMDGKARSRFLSRLDEMLNAIRRENPAP